MKIALCMGINDYYEHGVARGVIRFSKERGWNLSGYGWMFGSLGDISGWNGDGIVARIESESDAELFGELDIPVVDVAGAYGRSRLYQVNNDDGLTGKRAGEHLRERGFINFAFCGVEEVGWSERRLKGFHAGTGSAGKIPVFERSLAWWERLDYSEDLNRWLKELPVPGALFACNDTAGVKTAAACRIVGISVPGELAVLGVDNEDILCELADPSLSSVQLDCEEIGYRAAGLLGAVLGAAETGRLPRPAVLVPPKGIVERESTKIFVSVDPVVQGAVNYIKANARLGIGVADTAEAVNVSRRTLESRFRKILGRTVYEEIVSARLSWAEMKLVSSNITVDAAACESGFGSIQRFHAAFRNKYGTTPGNYRKLYRRQHSILG